MAEGSRHLLALHSNLERTAGGEIGEGASGASTARGAREVEVVVDGKMQRAKVRSADAKEDEYELSVWTDGPGQDGKYEAGVDTSKPKLITVPRREVYANRKHKQTLSPEALALANYSCDQIIDAHQRTPSVFEDASDGRGRRGSCRVRGAHESRPRSCHSICG